MFLKRIKTLQLKRAYPSCKLHNSTICFFFVFFGGILPMLVLHLGLLQYLTIISIYRIGSFLAKVCKHCGGK